MGVALAAAKQLCLCSPAATPLTEIAWWGHRQAPYPTGTGFHGRPHHQCHFCFLTQTIETKVVLLNRRSITWSVKDAEQFLECAISKQAEPANTGTWEDALEATSHSQHQILHPPAQPGS